MGFDSYLFECDNLRNRESLVTIVGSGTIGHSPYEMLTTEAATVGKKAAILGPYWEYFEEVTTDETLMWSM